MLCKKVFTSIVYVVIIFFYLCNLKCRARLFLPPKLPNPDIEHLQDGRKGVRTLYSNSLHEQVPFIGNFKISADFLGG